MAMVSFIDETTSGERQAAWHLEIFEETLPLREVIRRRVFQEVAEHNAAGAGLPQEPAEQVVRALESFERNGFVVLVGDRQIEDLDAVVDLRMGTEITFLKLVPLVGG
jgi:hypothetical protein